MARADRPRSVHIRLSEGWQFDRDEDTDRDFICRVTPGLSNDDTPCVFESDEEALAFVQQRAAEGSEYHQECLAYAVAERMTR